MVHCIARPGVLYHVSPNIPTLTLERLRRTKNLLETRERANAAGKRRDVPDPESERVHHAGWRERRGTVQGCAEVFRHHRDGHFDADAGGKRTPEENRNGLATVLAGVVCTDPPVVDAVVLRI